MSSRRIYPADATVVADNIPTSWFGIMACEADGRAALYRNNPTGTGSPITVTAGTVTRGTLTGPPPWALTVQPDAGGSVQLWTVMPGLVCCSTGGPLATYTPTP